MGSAGIWMVWVWSGSTPLSSEARPLREPIWIVTSFGAVRSTLPVTEPMAPALSFTALGPSAGSAVIVATPWMPSPCSRDANVMSAVPLIWSTVAPLKDELRCTPVALALTLLMSNLPAGTLLALMSITPTSCAATWVRNGKPSMLTDGFADIPDDDSILLAIVFCAYALATWSPMTKSTASTTSTM